MRRRSPAQSTSRAGVLGRGRDRRRLLPRVRRAACRSPRARRSCCKAVFTTETDLQIPSPVRVAGVDVGQVLRSSRLPGSRAGGGGDDGHQPQRAADSRRCHDQDPAADLPRGQLLRRSAPRHARTPRTMSLRRDGPPAANTAGPVQLDRVLAALNSDARANLQTLLRGLGSALDARPTRRQDSTQDPSVRGADRRPVAEPVAASTRSTRFASSAIVNQALLGLRAARPDKGGSGQSAGVPRAGGGRAQLPESGQHVQRHHGHAGRAASSSSADDRASCRRCCARTADAPIRRSTLIRPDEGVCPRDPARDSHQLDPTIGAALPWLAQATRPVLAAASWEGC